MSVEEKLCSVILGLFQRVELGYRGDGRAGSGLSEISLTSFLLLKLVLCLGKSRRSCGQLAKLSSKYKGEEREEKPDLPETTESKNGAA